MFYKKNNYIHQYSRSRPTKKVNISNLVSEGDEFLDLFFGQLYDDFALGKAEGLITRISSDRISVGHLKKLSSGKFKFINKTPAHATPPDVNEEVIENISRGIIIGERPMLYVYKNFRKEVDVEYISSDDEVVYKAYESLGIESIPVLILGDHTNLENSGIKVKSIPELFDGSPYLTITSTVSIKEDTMKLLDLEDKSLLSYSTELKKISHIKKTGVEASEILNDYNDTIAAIFKRASEMVVSFDTLIKLKHYPDAMNILRSFIELYTIFYLELVGNSLIYRIKKISVQSKRSGFTRSETVNYILDTYQNDFKLNNNVIKYLRKRYNYSFDLFDKVQERLQFSSIPESLLKDSYHSLSNIIHGNSDYIFSLIDNSTDNEKEVVKASNLIRIISSQFYIQIKSDLPFALFKSD